jgi:hypothetical protein
MDIKKQMKITGEIAISNELVKNNNMRWNQYDFFKYEFKRLVRNPFKGGWYAYKLQNNIHRFKWTDGDYFPNPNYINLLKKDKWTT